MRSGNIDAENRRHRTNSAAAIDAAGSGRAAVLDYQYIFRRSQELMAAGELTAAPPSNLREAIEAGANWWPLDVATDGSDHLSLRELNHPHLKGGAL